MGSRYGIAVIIVRGENWEVRLLPTNDNQTANLKAANFNLAVMKTSIIELLLLLLYCNLYTLHRPFPLLILLQIFNRIVGGIRHT